MPENKLPAKNTKGRTKDPLEGVTLEKLLTELVDGFGWKLLNKKIPLQCFYNNPSITSSLKFLRRTPWARARVEKLYLQFLKNGIK
jgi:uncharacterized protein (DUF2132 family)